MTPGRDRGPGVGVITALPLECFAMQTMLDDVAEVDAPDPRDPSAYYLGTASSTIAGHPHLVVVSLLPMDGAVSAAAACTNMQRSWDVHDVIMCGIACGVPAPDDPPSHVRLGDILVADEGVVPYGHVRVLADGESIRRHAALPSARLRRAVRKLRTDEEAGLRPWEQYLDVARRPELRAYRRPPAATDVLYADDPPHRPVAHPAQPGRRQNRPMVHYGLLGSGGKLIRTAAERNRLGRAYRLIGLDMEGDGVSDGTYLQGVDWYMVRGVSDYGAGKNDIWQRYAALAAAAYVRAVLRHLRPASAPPGPAAPTGRPTSTTTGAPAAAPRPAAEALDRDGLHEITSTLLTLRAVSDRNSRDRIVEALPDDLPTMLSRQPDAYGDTAGLVQLMARRPEGLLDLGRAVAAQEGDSRSMRLVWDVLHRYAAL